MSDLVFATHPWRDPVRMEVPDHLTLAEMAARVPGLPASFWERGAIYVDGNLVFRQFWRGLRPIGRRVVHLALAPAGDDKNPVAIIASLALVVLTGGIAAGVVIPGLAAGSFAANLVAAGVGLVGQLVIKSLFPPPQPKTPGQDDPLGAATVGDNVLEPGAPIPRVVGTHRVKPPLAAYPRTYVDGNDQVAEALYCLAGPHRIEDLRVGDVPIEDLNNVEYEIREGWDSDTPVTLVREQVRQEQVNIKLSKHVLRNDADNDKALDTSRPAEKAIPQWHRVATRKGPDEIAFTFAYSAILDADSIGDKQRLHLRWRVRKRGDTAWMNLSEIRYLGRAQGQQRLELRLILDRAAGASSPAAPQDDTFIGVDDSIPDVTVDHVITKDDGNPQWVSDFTLEGKVEVHRNGINIYPDDVWFRDPDAVFEFEFKRSEMIKESSWFAETHYGFPAAGIRKDPFDAALSGDTWDVHDNPKGKTSNEVTLVSVTSHWREHPVKGYGLALIALRYRNQDLSNFSVLASGYVRDWDGRAWSQWRVTSNPAPHYRDILAGDLTADPLPAARVSDQQLLAWRAECAARGYDCNVALTGRSVSEARQIVAAVGFAQPRQSETWGVYYEHDRSAEPVLQTFTPRNSAGFVASKAFSRRPRALRVSFLDGDDLFEPAEILADDPVPETTSISEPEAIDYPGVTSEAAARRRALYDMAQARERAIIYSLEVDMERLQVQRGDLVGLNHDVIDLQVGWARIVSVAGADLVVDDDLPFLDADGLFNVTDLFNRTDMFLLGRQSGAAVRTADGVTTIVGVAAWSAATRTLTLAVEAPAAAGDLVVIGRLGKEYRRCLVQNIRATSGLNGRISLVDEAPGLIPA